MYCKKFLYLHSHTYLLAMDPVLITGSTARNIPPPPTLAYTMAMTRLVWTACTLPNSMPSSWKWLSTMAIPSLAGNLVFKSFLRKTPGSICVADLHALGLLEADFNASMKILVIMWSAKLCSLISSHWRPVVVFLAAMLSKFHSVTVYLWLFPNRAVTLLLLPLRMLHTAMAKLPIIQHC